MSAYLTTCPKCGIQMTPYYGLADGAPWFCGQCHVSFWVAELSLAARKLYRPTCNDFGHTPAALALRELVIVERAAARQRGTSALPEHLGILALNDLEMLAQFPLATSFRTVVAAAIKARTPK